METETRQQIDAWIIEQILLAKATFLHAFYATMLPRHIYNEAAKDNLEKPMAYAKAEGFTVHEYNSAYGGETQIWKAGVIVAKFKPMLVDGPDGHKVMTFDATVLGKKVPCASLTESLR